MERLQPDARFMALIQQHGVYQIANWAAICVTYGIVTLLMVFWQTSHFDPQAGHYFVPVLKPRLRHHAYVTCSHDHASIRHTVSAMMVHMHHVAC